MLTVDLVKETVVNRQTWNRGRESRVLAGRAGKCCIGFSCEQSGVPLNLLKKHSSPLFRHLLVRGLAKIYKPGLYCPISVILGDWVGLAMQTNDDPNIDDKTREKLLKQHYRSGGYVIRFEN